MIFQIDNYLSLREAMESVNNLLAEHNVPDERVFHFIFTPALHGGAWDL